MSMNFQSDKPYIFISYSHLDTGTVLPILDILRQNNINIWYDDGIEAGSEWPEYIAQKIVDCDRFICFISDAYPLSQNCKRELNFAMDEKKEVLSVYISEKVSLPAGMRMQLGLHQSVFLSRHENTKSFCEYLCRENFVKSCTLASGSFQKAEKVDDNTDTDTKSVLRKILEEDPPGTQINNGTQTDEQNIKRTSPSKRTPKKPSVVKRLFALAIFAAAAFFVWNILMNAPFDNPKYKFAFIASLVIMAITALFRKILCFSDSDFKALSNFQKWMCFSFGTVAELLLNYYCCLLICKIPVLFHLLAISALIIIDLAICFIDCVAAVVYGDLSR